MRNKQPALIFILITIFIDSIGFGIVIPVFPDLIMSMENCDISRASEINGWLMACFAAMQFVFSPILGSLSDRFGRRPVLLLSLFGFALDYFLLAFAPSVGWLFLGRIIAGIMGASHSTAMAYIADISTEKDKSKNFGLIGAAFGLGFIIGPGLGGLLFEYGMRVPFIACAGLSMINWLYGYFILPESLKKENMRKFNRKALIPGRALVNMFKYKRIAPMMLCFFLLYLAATAVMVNWQFYTKLKFNWDEKAIGLSISIVGILVAIVQGLVVRKVNPAIGERNAILTGLFLYTIGMIAFGLAPTGTFMLLAMLPYCLGGINGPAMQSVITGSVPPNVQGELQGTIVSVQSLTSILGPIMMPAIFAYYTTEGHPYFPGAPFIAGAILIFIALIIAYFAFKTPSRPGSRRTESVLDDGFEVNPLVVHNE
ncbi:MAG TPA: TCR/Tet family MFS transporter [Flavobacteriales bacterium]